MIRSPVVAGQFYSASESLLKKELAGLIPQKKEKLDAIGVISPHAGYVYSGAVAGDVLSSIKPKTTYIIMGPNHTGYGKPFGLDAERNWQTPLGEVRVDKKMAEEILSRSKYIKKDTACHEYEHSIEVQLPFLQHINNDFTFVPIVIAHSSGEIYKAIGRELAEIVKAAEKEVLIIASSDMTHYEPHDSAKKKDMLAIEKILALDVDGFLDCIEKHDISMCGFAPAAIMLEASRTLGAKKTKLINYMTSGDTSGDYSSVVGYAGIVVYQ